MSGQYELTAEEKRRALESARALRGRLTREPTGGQGLREAIARGLHNHDGHRSNGSRCPVCLQDADAVLALPEMAALIADAERVRELEATVARVRALADRLNEMGDEVSMHWAADSIRRALDGDQ